PRYCRYSISNLAARVMESGGLGQGAHSSWSGVGRIGAVRHDFLIGICLRGVFWVADGGWCMAARVARVGDGPRRGREAFALHVPRNPPCGVFLLLYL